MSRKRKYLKPAVWAFYIVVVLEFLFMISPFALHFYSAYGPALNVFLSSPATSWLTGFFLPHFSATTSPVLNGLKGVGFLLAALGLLVFLVAAVQIYGGKLLDGARLPVGSTVSSGILSTLRWRSSGSAWC